MKTFTKFNPFVQVKPVINSVFPIFAKKLLKVFFMLLLLFSVSSIKAATYYLTSTGASNAHIPASWNTNPLGGGTAASNFTTNGDVFIVPNGISGTLNSNLTIGNTSNNGTWELRIEGTLMINDNIIITLQYRNNGQGSICTLNVNGNTGKIIFNDPDNSQIQCTTTVGGAGQSAINLNSGATLVTANANGIVGITGSINPLNILQVNLNSAANYEFSGSAQTTTGLPATVQNLTFSNTGIKTLAGDVMVANNLTINDEASLHIAPAQVVAALTVLNNAGVAGIFVDADITGVLPSGTLIFGNDISLVPVPATVRFYSKAFIDPDAKWQYFGIPFTQYVPGGTLGPYKKYSWDETYLNNTHWKIVEPDSTMLPFMGYAITQPSADYYDISGNLTNESLVMTLSYTPPVIPNDPNVYPGSHILANPYTASIPIASINFTGMEESVAFYNTGSYNDWLTNNSETYSNLPGQYLNVPKLLAGQPGLPAAIPSMQGFLVKVLNPNPPIPVKRETQGMQRFVPQILIQIPYLPVPNIEPLRTKKDFQPIVSSIIDIKGENLSDRMWLFTNASCTKDFDNGWDSRKLMGSNAAPQLFFVENDNKFQVSTVDDINGSFIGFRKGIDNEYTMTFTHNNTELAYPNGIYLIDLVANKTVNVTENGSSYTFTVSGSSLAKAAKAPTAPEVVRFKIVTSPGITTDINNTKNEIRVIVSEKCVIFDNQTVNQAQMTLFDVTGKVVMSSVVKAGVSTVNVNVPAGTYLVQVIADRTNIKSSIIIK
jgi:hypothetical protein